MNNWRGTYAGLLLWYMDTHTADTYTKGGIGDFGSRSCHSSSLVCVLWSSWWILSGCSALNFMTRKWSNEHKVEKTSRLSFPEGILHELSAINWFRVNFFFPIRRTFWASKWSSLTRSEGNDHQAMQGASHALLGGATPSLSSRRWRNSLSLHPPPPQCSLEKFQFVKENREQTDAYSCCREKRLEPTCPSQSD